MNEGTEAARVLIVDDEPANIQVLVEALPGYELSFATDGARALELATDQPFDLILLDVVMPGISGFEVLKWLKSEPVTAHVPVIFVTTLDELEDEEHGLMLGAVDYITKPIRPAIVRARVGTHIELKRQRDLLQALMPKDLITGIASRQAFEAELERAWGRTQRNGRPLTLMLVELDNFDRFVEEYGRSPAHECLSRVAKALESTYGRGDDMAARYADTQFAVLIEGAGEAAQIARALKAAAALEIPHVRSDCSTYVSVSVGAVCVSSRAESSAAASLALAEALLQTAILAGRNRGEFEDLVKGERCAVLAD